MENWGGMDPVQAAVKKLFGLDYLFPYQRLVVANILEAAQAAGININWPEDILTGNGGGDPRNNTNELFAENEIGLEDDRAGQGRQIVILPTGAGKSLCFQLPAMLLDGVTLVIYPILSLMADQERRLQEKNFAPVILRGGQSAEERAEIRKKLESGESRFIIANPEVLLTEKVMKMLPEIGISHIVIDESHCVSEWGESFRPSYLEIGKIIQAAAAPLVTAFTATASALVLEKIEKYIFDSRGAQKIIGNPDRQNIAYAAYGAILRDIAVRDLLVKNERPAIVFCSSRPGTEKLARYLRTNLNETEIKFYHAGLLREEKSDVEKWFFESDRGVLIATCAYGMGVDKSNIRTVIHRDCPPSPEAYLQESGRAGRDGKFSRAFLLWGPDDEGAMKRAKTDADRARLTGLFAYARDTKNCRRENLLKLLNYDVIDDKPETECCDVCAGHSSAFLREQKPITAFFRKNPRAFTDGEAAKVLARHQRAWSDVEYKLAIRGLIRCGALCEIKKRPWKGKIVGHL